MTNWANADADLHNEKEQSDMPTSTTDRPFRPRTVHLILLTVLLTLVILPGPAAAQDEGAVQVLTGTIYEGGLVYSLADLEADDNLYVYVEGISGDLDPAAGIAPPGARLDTLVQRYQSLVAQAVDAGEDPLTAIPQAGDELFMAWDDDSGGGYAAALAFHVPADGDYALVIFDSPNRPTSGQFRLLVGLNEPLVLSGTAAPTGARIALLDREASQLPASIQRADGSLSAEKSSTFFELADIKAGDTLYASVEAISGDLRPILTLNDFGDKPLARDNYDGQNSQASVAYTFGEDVSGYRLLVEACCEGQDLSSGDFRLLVGINAPEVLTGAPEEIGPPAFAQPLDAQVGFKLQQISAVDQKAENFGVVGTIRIDWEDPDLAFSPDSCQCTFKTYDYNAWVNFTNQNGIRWPDFTLFNQQGNRWSQNRLVVVRADGTATYFERFSATLQAPDFDFRRFPFDKQQFYVRVDSVFPVDYVTYRDMEGFTEVGQQLGEEEWVVTDYDVTVTEETASTQLLTSRYAFGFGAERHLSFYVLRIFVPVLIILLVSWFTFFLKDYGKRVDVAAGNLLLFIAFNFTISGDLPRLGYLTFMDTVLISTFVVTALVVILNVLLKRLEMSGRERLALRIDRYTIWVYPLAYLAAFFIVAFAFGEGSFF